MRSSRVRHDDITFIDVDDLDRLAHNNFDYADSVNVVHEYLVEDSSSDPLSRANELRAECDTPPQATACTSKDTAF